MIRKEKKVTEYIDINFSELITILRNNKENQDLWSIYIKPRDTDQYNLEMEERITEVD